MTPPPPPGMFDSMELEGKQVEVGGAVYEFPDYCSIVGAERGCVPEGTSVTVGIKVGALNSH